jgi:glycosyltransferase involved in cell wall biosynthesis
VRRLHQDVLAERRRLGLEGVLQVTGFVPDVAAWMAASDLVVCPSRDEPFGLVVVEALALGRCVLVSDSGGPAEIVEDGVSGVHFRTGDAAALAEAALRLLDDPERRERLAAEGRRRAAMRYDPGASSRSLESLYASLA